MNLSGLQKRFNTQAKCISYLTKVRWGKKPTCPYCNSQRVVRLKKEFDRYHCYECRKSFSVTVGTIFEDSKLPLPKWFQIILLMTNAKMGISAKDIQRNTGVTYKTAWYIAMRIRCAMIDHCNIELTNVVEMDEAYVGGKPRHRNKKTESIPSISAKSITTVKPKRGRGTSKTPVVGIVERHGKVVLQVMEKLTSRNLMDMLKKYVRIDRATLMTDEYRGYAKMDDIVDHFVIEHQREYVKGAIHTNTIEGFWSIIKNSIKGNHRKISKKYLPFYLVQAQYMYNNRTETDLFEDFIKEALSVDRTDFMNKYKIVKPAKKLVYGKKCNQKETA